MVVDNGENKDEINKNLVAKCRGQIINFLLEEPAEILQYSRDFGESQELCTSCKRYS